MSFDEGKCDAAGCRKAEGFDGKGRETVHPQGKRLPEAVVADPDRALPLLHLHIHYVLSGTKHEAGEIGIGILVLDHLILDKAFHN